MAIFNKDMVELATRNTHFQKEAYRDDNVQIVLMSIEPGEDIGAETHKADQTTFFVAGEGQAVIDGHRTKVTANHMIVIPQGAEHNIINKGDVPLKLFSVYAPPAEDPGVDHKTKAEADAAEGKDADGNEKGVLGKIAEKLIP
jgi:mannose-6-phosphate isomerase-like protein (cupin superfamily)